MSAMNGRGFMLESSAASSAERIAPGGKAIHGVPLGT